jgi:hypothetical protein
LIGDSFRYFDRIMERKGGIERKDPIGGIDRLMLELWEERVGDAKPIQEVLHPQRIHALSGYALLVPMLVGIWAACLIPLVISSA